MLFRNSLTGASSAIYVGDGSPITKLAPYINKIFASVFFVLRTHFVTGVHI